MSNVKVGAAKLPAAPKSVKKEKSAADKFGIVKLNVEALENLKDPDAIKSRLETLHKAGKPIMVKATRPGQYPANKRRLKDAEFKIDKPQDFSFYWHKLIS